MSHIQKLLTIYIIITPLSFYHNRLDPNVHIKIQQDEWGPFSYSTWCLSRITLWNLVVVTNRREVLLGQLVGLLLRLQHVRVGVDRSGTDDSTRWWSSSRLTPLFFV
jgi:hypothetical protein